MVEVFTGAGVEEMGINIQDMLGGMFPKRRSAASLLSGKRVKYWSSRRRKSLSIWMKLFP